MNLAINLIDDTIPNADDLSARLTLLTRWGHLTRKQSATLARLISPKLPCSVSVSKRAERGSVYVRANSGPDGDLVFRLDPSARLHDAPSLLACQP